jgi:hypothetical protein
MCRSEILTACQQEVTAIIKTVTFDDIKGQDKEVMDEMKLQIFLCFRL